MQEAGVVSQEIRNIITRNKRELTSVEGNILSMVKDKDIRTILVTSCNPSEGKTVSAVSMAYGLQNDTQLKVLLVDGNLRAPKIHEIFNVENSPGFSDFILNDAATVFRETEFRQLAVMPHGTDVSNPLDVFRSEEFKVKLSRLREMFDYVIFDGHSILSSSDISVAARFFDGVVVVLECEKTKWEVLDMATEKISKLKANIIGVVLNRRKYYIPRALYGKI